MASYRLVFRKSVSRDLRRIPATDVRRIIARIDRLRDDPRGEGCVRLSGQERYRVRQGRYRILYEINDGEVLVIVVKVAHRSTAYRGNP